MAAVQAGSTEPGHGLAGRLVASLVFQGPKGDPGPIGPNGNIGAQGLVGPIGQIGPQGKAGAAGTAGNTGQAGPAGVAGEKGSTGSTGDTGAQGSQGPTGSTGSTGPAGATGPQGPSGVASCQYGDCLSLQGSSPGTQETGSINISDDAIIGGSVSAANFSGDGSALSSLNASQLTSGTVNTARLPASVTLQGNTFNGDSELVQLTVGGLLPVLDGSNLTDVTAATLQGNSSSYFTNASNISSGTLADTQLSNNVALLDATQTFSGVITLSAAGTALSVTNDVSVGGTLGVSGLATLGSLSVTGSASAVSLTVTGNAAVGSLTYGTTITSSCAGLTNYIWIPGSSKYGTLPGFCVMKYGASSADGNPSSSNYGPGEAVSNGALPWVNISQINAETAAANACTDGCHLITEAEWMTIAENALMQPANWTGGSVGSGALYSGHNDNAPSNALAADTSSDTDGYYGETNQGGNQRRVLWIDNGNGQCLNNDTGANPNCEAIWDIGGNVWEWTDAWILGNDEPMTATAGFGWNDFTAITQWKGLQYANPTDRGWNSTQGLGQIYSENSSTDATQYGFIRGGNWADGGSAGAFTLYLSVTPTYTGGHIGFRVAR